MGTEVSSNQSSQEDLLLTYLTPRSCNLKSLMAALVVAVSTGPYGLVPYLLLEAFLLSLLTWNFCLCHITEISATSLQMAWQSAACITAEVCLESRMLIKQFFTR